MVGSDRFENLYSESIACFELLFNQIEDFLFILDENGMILHANNVVLNRLGYTQEEITGISIIQMHPQDRREEALEIVWKMIEGSTQKSPIPILTKLGEKIPVETKVFKGRWKGKNVLFGISKDLSEIKMADERFHKAFTDNHSLMAISKIDTGEFIDVNEAFLHTLGFERKEVIGKTAFDLNIFFDNRNKKYNILEMEEYGFRRNRKIKIRDKKGNIIVGIFSGDYIAIANTTYLLTIMSDITEKRKSEQEVLESRKKLKESEENFKFLFESMTNSCILHEMIKNEEGEPIDFRIVYANSATEMLFDKKVEHIIGKTITEINPSADKEMIKKYCEVGRTRKFLKMEYLLDTFNKWVSVYAFNLRKDQLAVVYEDITEIKIMKDALLKEKELAEKANNMKSLFLADMSHEIRTPLNGIVGYLDLLEQDNLTEQQRLFLKNAKISTELLKHLINDILDFSKIELGKLGIENECFVMSEIIEEAITVIKLKANEKGLALYLNLDEDMGLPIWGDPFRVKQIIINLLSNAKKFTSKGEIRLRAKRITKNDKFITISIEIEDTGIGLKSYELENIFKAFTKADSTISNHYEGTGLGLAISKKLAKLMGGDITVNSEFGKGSNFCFKATFNLNGNDENSIKGCKNDEHLYAMKIIKTDNLKSLVVEDNKMNRDVLKYILESKGLGCNMVQNGKQALEACKTSDYDIIFMDCNIPVMDGYETSKEIRKLNTKNKQPIIIAITANAILGEMEKCLSVGMNDYLSKPITKSIVFDILKKYFGDTIFLDCEKEEALVKEYDEIDYAIKQLVNEACFKEENARASLKNYMEKLPLKLKNMKMLIDLGEADKVRSIIHEIKGTSSNIWLTNLAKITSEFDKILSEGKESNIKYMFDKLEKYICNMLNNY